MKTLKLIRRQSQTKYKPHLLNHTCFNNRTIAKEMGAASHKPDTYLTHCRHMCVLHVFRIRRFHSAYDVFIPHSNTFEQKRTCFPGSGRLELLLAPSRQLNTRQANPPQSRTFAQRPRTSKNAHASRGLAAWNYCSRRYGIHASAVHHPLTQSSASRRFQSSLDFFLFAI